MKWNGLMTITFAALVALALAGCDHTKGKAPPPKVSTETARQVCEIDSLAREHQVLITSIGLEKDASNTIASQKLKDFRGEVDASYRFVVQNCNNYNMCMQSHDYNEPSCDTSRTAWTESHRKFNELTSRLAEIEAHHPPGGKPSKPRPPKGGCNCDEVFTTGCCNENY
jgi:hypothetical protein